MTRPQTRPLTLGAWLCELRRRGVRCRLIAGHVRVNGLKRLSAAERVHLFGSAPMVQQLLEQRAQRRRPKQQEQQLMATTQPQHMRRVIGQIVSPGRPLRLLFEDEVREIPLQRARVLMTIPWRR